MSAPRPSPPRPAFTPRRWRRIRAPTSTSRPTASATRAPFSCPIRPGRSNLVSELARLGVEAEPNDPRLQRLLDTVKEREAQGYAYEAADASFELLARGVLGGVPEFFAVESFHVGVERKVVAPGVTYSASQAVVKIRIGEERLISAAEGNGPVNALDLALRKDLGVYQKHIEDLELRDYRVRVFQGGTDAVTRVLIEFGDGNGDTWSTVGVSGNIIDASFQALVDAITYRLVKLGVAGAVSMSCAALASAAFNIALGACLRISGFWWRLWRESDSAFV